MAETGGVLGTRPALSVRGWGTASLGGGGAFGRPIFQRHAERQGKEEAESGNFPLGSPVFPVWGHSSRASWSNPHAAQGALGCGPALAHKRS